jgi:hypothetical protein
LAVGRDVLAPRVVWMSSDAMDGHNARIMLALACSYGGW